MRTQDAALAGLPPVSERISARARNIRIEVRPDGEVRLVIPRHASRRAAYDFLQSRADWVRSKLIELNRRQAAAIPRRTLNWDGADLLSLRGRDLPLLRVPARPARIAVRFDDDAVRVLAPAAAPAVECARALRGALRELARSEAEHWLLREAVRLDVDYVGPRIADQKSLWGSCSPQGLISLSWRLVLAPPEVFRYVVVHELCHRRHLDHSARFWRLVSRQMPDYETPRAWLREHGPMLHAVLSS